MMPGISKPAIVRVPAASINKLRELDGAEIPSSDKASAIKKTSTAQMDRNKVNKMVFQSFFEPSVIGVIIFHQSPPCSTIRLVRLFFANDYQLMQVEKQYPGH